MAGGAASFSCGSSVGALLAAALVLLSPVSVHAQPAEPAPPDSDAAAGPDEAAAGPDEAAPGPDEAAPEPDTGEPAPDTDGPSAEAAEPAPQPPAAAPTSDDALARERFRLGQTLYYAGRFTEAAQEFESAYALSSRPELLFNLYLAYRDAGRAAAAVDRLERYLEALPDAPNADRLRVRLRGMQEALESRRAAEERRRRQRAAPASGRSRGVAGWVIGGVGAGMLAAGAITGVTTLSRVDNMHEACPDLICPGDYDLDGERHRTRRLRNATDALLFGGGAIFATGALLVLLRVGGERRPDVALSCGPGGCAGTLRVGF